MKGILEFKLPEEQEDFDLANKAGKYALVLDEVARHLRNKIKYEELSEEVLKALDETRQVMFEAAQEEGIDI